jgi:hypothetical protein
MSGWTDACILNVSSHGMMINAPAASAAKGSRVELWHGEHLIVATVVWRKGTRAGIQAEDRIPVDEILAISQPPSLQLTGAWPDVERRKRPRSHDDQRFRGRSLQFAATAAVAISLALGSFVMIETAFAAPLRLIHATLGG